MPSPTCATASSTILDVVVATRPPRAPTHQRHLLELTLPIRHKLGYPTVEVFLEMIFNTFPLIFT